MEWEKESSETDLEDTSKNTEKEYDFREEWPQPPDGDPSDIRMDQKGIDYPLKFLKVHQLLDKDTAQELAKFIRKYHYELVDLNGGAGTCEMYPSNSFKYNWLKTHFADWLVPGIRSVLEELGRPKSFWSACWAAVYDKGMGITPHIHADADDIGNKNRDFISGTMFLDGPPNIGTLYGLEGPAKPWHHALPKSGECYWFPNYLIHAARKNPYDIPRVVLNFDIYPTDIEPPNDTRFADRFIFHDENSSAYYDAEDDPEFGQCKPKNWFGQGSHPEWVATCESQGIPVGPDVIPEKEEPDLRDWETYCKEENIDPSPLEPFLRVDETEKMV